ncbi:hypothetical protein LA080_002390 [Diaporthe eres]|nr:hypothetical protein LA080_002390 [Diaporthe eres]
MYRRAATHRGVSALWRGTPLAGPAVPSRFAAPRPKIPSPRNTFASPIKYKPNLVSFRPFTELSGVLLVDEVLKEYGYEDLLPYHDLHVVNERPSQQSHGATSYQVREHFNSWVAQSLANRLSPNSVTTIEDLGWTNTTNTPRYEYCLVVDSLCLESLDHPSLISPVVKLVDKNWGDPLSPQERQSAQVYPGFHDGITEEWEEDVGWMYLSIIEYVERYAELHDLPGTALFASTFSQRLKMDFSS